MEPRNLFQGIDSSSLCPGGPGQTPQLFVNSICRKGKRLFFKSILKQISYISVFFKRQIVDEYRLWAESPATVERDHRCFF
jgi:hypothetical protein